MMINGLLTIRNNSPPFLQLLICRSPIMIIAIASSYLPRLNMSLPSVLNFWARWNGDSSVTFLTSSTESSDSFLLVFIYQHANPTAPTAPNPSAICHFKLEIPLDDIVDFRIAILQSEQSEKKELKYLLSSLAKKSSACVQINKSDKSQLSLIGSRTREYFILQHVAKVYVGVSSVSFCYVTVAFPLNYSHIRKFVKVDSNCGICNEEIESHEHFEQLYCQLLNNTLQLIPLSNKETPSLSARSTNTMEAITGVSEAQPETLPYSGTDQHGIDS
ncbi:hypothetical protein HUJ04_010179 [Dendroctonus ponderosae]|nr:hypothetical protein HUJ04_010179 [Dendroctonus ponderosae]